MVNLPVKRERFVQAYVGGMNATQAYIKAGYSESGAAPNAARLIRNDNVKLRIKELQDDLRGQTMISLQTIVEELINDRTTARRLSNINASIKANVELAKLHGLYDQHNRQKKLPEMDVGQLVARARKLADIIERNGKTPPNISIQ